MSGESEAESHYRTGSDSEQHEAKQRQQVDILLEFMQSSRNYCVCVVDIVSSTSITMGMPHDKMTKYYQLFLNKMAETAARFGAVVVKNVGDSLLYYFPATDSGSAESFSNVLECSLAMLNARPALNDAMHREGLPDVSYRISCEYGQVAVARVSTSSIHDIFGTAVNMSSKINNLAPPNQIVVGNGFYMMVKGIEGCEFTRVENAPGIGPDYAVYIFNKRG